MPQGNLKRPTPAPTVPQTTQLAPPEKEEVKPLQTDPLPANGPLLKQEALPKQQSVAAPLKPTLYGDLSQPLTRAILWLLTSVFDKKSDFIFTQSHENTETVLEVNPLGSLPVMHDVDTLIVSNNDAFLYARYLAQKHPQQRERILPKNSQLETILAWYKSIILPLTQKLKEGGNTHEQLKVRIVSTILPEMEAKLGRQPYICENAQKATIADIVLFCDFAEVIRDHFESQRKNFPYIEAWLQRVKKDPILVEVLQQYPF
ncbi:hypothetical protein FGO68_gene2052 [Halteria grandinella]|uniref:GST C-terminal domain-containing protein n=1 Tax=Halteria grandinella TaxID=5974 RepID=A0A8J8T4K6_HALGN|nr:hypothetical protein FGO68_gene2052 [Halteria grandinella]